jgi:predicted N-acetyltransferase YhbS
VCRIWAIGVGEREALFLGPLAVDPGAQHGGVGAALVRECVAAAEATDAAAILCVGSAPFFAPMGFSRVPPGRVLMPGPVDPERFLWRALHPGALEALAGPISAPRVASRE